MEESFEIFYVILRFFAGLAVVLGIIFGPLIYDEYVYAKDAEEKNKRREAEEAKEEKRREELRQRLFDASPKNLSRAQVAAFQEIVRIIMSKSYIMHDIDDIDKTLEKYFNEEADRKAMNKVLNIIYEIILNRSETDKLRAAKFAKKHEL